MIARMLRADYRALHSSSPNYQRRITMAYANDQDRCSHGAEVQHESAKSNSVNLPAGCAVAVMREYHKFKGAMFQDDSIQSKS